MRKRRGKEGNEYRELMLAKKGILYVREEGKEKAKNNYKELKTLYFGKLMIQQ